MIRLRPVISVREIPPAYAKSRAGLPSMASLVSESPSADEPKLLRYLQCGVFGCFFPDPGLGHDVLAPGKKVDRELPREALDADEPDAGPAPPTAVGVSGVFTDGVWLWPGVLAYYVAKYHVRVDPEFIDHARARNWTVPAGDVRLEELSFDAFTEPEVAQR
jgi:hypothetical protein